MYDEISYMEDCIECEDKNSLSVRAIADVDSGEIVKFITQVCYNCGWNQLS
jgi:hypothetical protein